MGSKNSQKVAAPIFVLPMNPGCQRANRDLGSPLGRRLFVDAHQRKVGIPIDRVVLARSTDARGSLAEDELRDCRLQGQGVRVVVYVLCLQVTDVRAVRFENAPATQFLMQVPDGLGQNAPIGRTETRSSGWRSPSTNFCTARVVRFKVPGSGEVTSSMTRLM